MPILLHSITGTKHLGIYANYGQYGYLFWSWNWWRCLKTTWSFPTVWYPKALILRLKHFLSVRQHWSLGDVFSHPFWKFLSVLCLWYANKSIKLRRAVTFKTKNPSAFLWEHCMAPQKTGRSEIIFFTPSFQSADLHMYGLGEGWGFAAHVPPSSSEHPFSSVSDAPGKMWVVHEMGRVNCETLILLLILPPSHSHKIFRDRH